MLCNNPINVTSKQGSVYLGVWGESNVRSAAFDISSWQTTYGDGTLQIIANRPGETLETGELLIYEVSNVSIEGGVATWTFDDVDTAIVGNGSCALIYRVGSNVVAKSTPYKTYIADTLGHSGAAVPPALEAWYADVLRASADAQSAAERAEGALDKLPYPNVETRTWWRWNGETGAWEDTGEPYSGQGGALPPGGTPGQYLAKTGTEDGEADWRPLPVYAGAYEVTPLARASTTMQTAQTYLDRDIVVRAIPYQEVSNLSGGNTATIGG